jgi:hypothetical protein
MVARIDYGHTAFESFLLSGIGILIFIAFGADIGIYQHWGKVLFYFIKRGDGRGGVGEGCVCGGDSRGCGMLRGEGWCGISKSATPLFIYLLIHQQTGHYYTRLFVS